MAEIVNITNKLKEPLVYNNKTVDPKYFAKFNNSIQHVKDNIYIMLYRTVWNGAKDEVKSIYEKGHHWAHSIAWFYIMSGKKNRERIKFYNSTIATFLKIENGKIEVIKSKHLEQFDNYFEDLRISNKVQKKDGKIHYMVTCTYGSNWYPKTYYIGKKAYRYGPKLFLMEVDPNDLELKFLDDVNSDKTLLCTNQSQYRDKNWSIWTFNQKIFFTYSLSPYVVLEMEEEPNNCKKTMVDRENIFTKMEKLHRTKTIDIGKNQLYFRLTTPAIKFNDKEYIGVGHAVFNPYLEELMYDTLNSDLKIYKFIKNAYARFHFKAHPSFKVYFMFFYTFNPETRELLRISDCFIPFDKTDKNHTLIVFPMSITQYHDNKREDNKKFIVSYGQGDYQTNLLFIDTKKINSMLYDINKKKPEDYGYNLLE